MSRSRSLALLTALVLLAGCAGGLASHAEDYRPLTHAWESDLAGRDLSADGTLGYDLARPSQRLQDWLLRTGDRYLVLDPERATVAVWVAYRGAQPFESGETRWQLDCIHLAAENNRLATRPARCPRGLSEDPPTEAQPTPTTGSVELAPWPPSNTYRGTDRDICAEDVFEAVLDDVTLAGSRTTARLSLRNTASLGCTVLGTPALQSTAGGVATVLTRHGPRAPVRLEPGESVTSTVSWQTTFDTGRADQRLYAGLGGPDAVEVVIDPVFFGARPQHDLRMSRWAEPTSRPRPTDSAAPAVAVSPDCEADRLDVQWQPGARSVEASERRKRHGELALTNTSYRPCRLTGPVTLGRSTPPTQLVSRDDMGQVVLAPGRAASADVSWLPGLDDPQGVVELQIPDNGPMRVGGTRAGPSGREVTLGPWSG